MLVPQHRKALPGADGNASQLKMATTKDRMADAAEFKPIS
jgi:hypothetical protein